MPETMTRSFMRTRVAAEQRTGYCEICGTRVEKIMTTYTDALGHAKTAPRPICPRCGGQGRLIVRHVSVQPPDPPGCLSFGCVARFMRESIFSMLVAAYHKKRVFYASTNRDKKILERYRTGEPAPENIWQAIHANIKLRCPVCRRYNVDPLLFRR